jgi:TonB family protein
MCCKNVWEGLATFVLTLAIGVSAGNWGSKNSPASNEVNVKPPAAIVAAVDEGDGASSPGENRARNFGTGTAPDAAAVAPLKIVAKPRALYTGIARANSTQGRVILKVTFTASGVIGAVIPVQTLPDGLTEQAIAAARQIEFEPARSQGTPVTVSKTVVYDFAIY